MRKRPPICRYPEQHLRQSPARSKYQSIVPHRDIMFERIRRRRCRNQKAVPPDLPPTVKFDVIDYDGERLYLTVPIEAVVVIEEDNDIFLLNGETFVYGIGPTLEDAMEDFCGSFLLCYRIMIKYGPGINNWNQIMFHVYGWRRGRTYGGADHSQARCLTSC